MHRALVLILPLSLMACQPIHESSQAAARVTKAAFNDEVNTWIDVFTYHPPKPPQEPQTRYCYKMQSDVVCYDSVQTAQTSKLVGYQDGDQISWVQPGGGSLGASGGQAMAPRKIAGVQEIPGSADYAMDMGPGSITVQDTPKVVTAPFNAQAGASHAQIIANPTIKGPNPPPVAETPAAVATANAGTN